MRYKEVFAGIAVGLVLGVFQGGAVVSGITDTAVPSASFAKFIGVGVALGFFLGLASMSKANNNSGRVAGFAMFLTLGITALAINLYRGFVSSDMGFNSIALIASAYVPSMIVGGYASAIFSKGSE